MLRNQSNPDSVRNLFITPDLTPLEQKKSKASRQQLSDMNKSENAYVIKNGCIVWKKRYVGAVCTDNFNTYDNSRNIDSCELSLILNCHSILPKQAQFCATIATYNPDIIFASETWFLSLRISSGEFLPDDYIAYRCDSLIG